MKISLSILVAALALSAEAATIHRRHIHKRHDTDRRSDLIKAMALKKRTDHNHHPDLIGALNFKRSSHGHMDDDIKAISIKKRNAPTHGGKCHPVEKGQWVEMPSSVPDYETDQYVEPAPVDQAQEAETDSYETQPPNDQTQPVVPPTTPDTSYQTDQQPQGDYNTEPATPAPVTPAPSTGNKKFGVTYSLFQEGFKCLSDQQVDTDLREISKYFESVRFYSTECNCLKLATPACKETGLKLILGAFIKREDPNFVYQDIQNIIDWAGTGGGSFDYVKMIVVGNESLFNKDVDAGTLISIIDQCRQKLRQAGYKGIVTTVETTGSLQENKSICDSCEGTMGVNVHPFFNNAETPENCGNFLQGQIGVAQQACPGKEIYVLEAGWPSGGNANGAAIPNEQNQKVCVDKMRENDGGKCVYFSWANEQWKPQNQFNCEKSFGLGKIFEQGASIVDNVANKISDAVGDIKDDVQNAVNKAGDYVDGILG